MKRWLSLLLTVCMLLTIAPMPALAEDAQIVARGACGEKAVWTLDSEGVLCLGGEGAVEDYAAPQAEEGVQPPWAEAREDIKEVRVLEGVTALGENCLSGCEALTEVSIPVSLTKIGDGAFAGCPALEKLNFAGTAEQWSETPLEAGDQAALLASLPMTVEVTPEHLHDYDDGVVTAEPACEQAGEKTFACRLCGETKTEPVAALEHTWNEGVVTTEPSCETAGEKTFTCERCGATRTEEIPAIGEHAWNEGVVTTQPSCEKAGEMTYTCERCDATRTEEIPAIGEHVWNEGVVTTEPSCLTAGEKTFTCTVCGTTRTETIEPYGEHAWDEGVITTEPGCDSEGVKTFTCTRCGETKTESVPATGHSWHYQSGSGSDHHYVVRTCENCGKEYRIDTTDELIVQNGECGTDTFYALTSGNKLYYFGCGTPSKAAPVTGVEAVYYGSDLKGTGGAGTLPPGPIREIHVDIPNVEIDTTQFENRSSLRDLYLPDSAQIEAAFSGTTAMYQFVRGGTVSLHITRDTGTIRAGYMGRRNVNCNQTWTYGLKDIIIEEGVTAVGDGAFTGVTLLTDGKLVLPTTMEYVGKQAFFESNMRTIEMRGGLAGVGESAFLRVKGEFIISDQVNMRESLILSKSGYYNCGITREQVENAISHAQSLTIGNCFGSSDFNELTVSSESVVVEGCISDTLKTLQFADSVKSIQFKNTALQNCTSLKTIAFPNRLDVLNVGNNAFTNSRFVVSDWPEQISDAQIGNYAFSGASVQEIVLLAENGYAGMNAFANCKSLQSVTLTDTFTFDKVKYGESEGLFVGSSPELIIACVSGSIPEKFLCGVNRYSSNDKRQLWNGVRKLTIGEGITSIGSESFYSNPTLEEIVLPSSLLTLGANAFYPCPALKAVTLSGATVVGDNAFKSCGALESITFTGEPEAMEIGASAFYGCAQLSSLVFPESAGTIRLGNEAFSGCTALQELSFPAQMDTLSIGASAFSGIAAEEIPLPDGLSALTVGDRAFANAVNLKRMDLAADTVSLGMSVFLNCTSLEEVSLPDNTKMVDGTNNKATTSLATGCSATLRVKYQQGFIADNFMYGPNRTYNMNTPAQKSFALGFVKLVVEPGITSIGANAFRDAVELREIVLPEGLTEIKASAFQKCSALQQLPDLTGIQTFGNLVFADCTGLTHVDFPYDAASCGTGLFKGCTGLTELIIDRDGAVIPRETFYGCSSVERVVVSGSGVTLLAGAIGNKNGAEVYLADSTILRWTSRYDPANFNGGIVLHVTKDTGKIINYFLFQSYGGNVVLQARPTKIIIEEGITEIGSYAFQDATAKTVVFPESLEVIGERAFNGSKLETITFPNDTVQVKPYAFSGCGSLTELYYPVGVTFWKSSFQDCNGLKTVHFASGVKTIPDNCFYGCDALENLDFEDPNTGVDIGEHAFSMCKSIRELHLPAGSLLRMAAFSECRAIEKIYTPQCTFFGRQIFSAADSLTDWYITDDTVFIPDHTNYGPGGGNAVLHVQCVTGKIPSYMFYDKQNRLGAFPKIVIEEGITEIGANAFCGNDTPVIELPQSLKKIGDYAFRDSAIESIELPAGLEEIGSNAFRESWLTEITLPMQLQKLGDYAFYGCQELESATLSANLREVPSSAFAACPKLKMIIIPATVTEIGDNAVGFDSTATIKDSDKPDTADNYNYTYTQIDGFEVYGYTGTAAERYADKCSLVFVPLDGNTDYDEESLRYDAAGAYAYGANLRLEGDIGINFFLQLSPTCLADESAVVNITLPNGTVESHPVSSLAVNTTSVPGKTLYVVRCYVKSYEMTGNISVQVVRDHGSLSGAITEYSVYQYICNILKKDSYSAELKELVRNLANYGAKAQLHFKKDTDRLADAGIDTEAIQTAMQALTAEELSGFAMARTEMPQGITAYGASLLLESTTTVRFYFRVEEGHEIGEYRFTSSGLTLTPERSGAYYVVDIPNIMAYDLDQMYRVTVERGSESGTVTYGAMSYVYNKLRSASTPQPLADLVRAICVYHRAAKAYFK